MSDTTLIDRMRSHAEKMNTGQLTIVTRIKRDQPASAALVQAAIEELAKRSLAPA